MKDALTDNRPGIPINPTSPNVFAFGFCIRWLPDRMVDMDVYSCTRGR